MKDSEVKIIKQAIISEVEGFEFYKIAAKEAPNEETKEAFLEIAEEERKHAEWLRSLFEATSKDGNDSYRLAMETEAEAPHLFKWENIDRQGASKAMSVFGIGMQMERAAVDFYKKAASETSMTEAKELFSKLAKWEQLHLEGFASEYEKLKEIWWSEQEYAPF